jgi:Ca-activated chloride channel homolog
VIQFGNPTALWWLVLVPVLALFLVWAYRARRRSLARFVAQPLADRLTQSVRLVARRWKAVLLVAGILFVVVALAQPRWGYEWRQVKRKGVDVFVLLDVSKSMLTEDVRPNRLAQAKFAVEDLLAKLQGDRIGLIAFAGTAFVQCPLTVDYDAFRLALRDADPRVIPRGGTAIAAALRTALKAFEAGEGRDRAVVIITDGEATEGDALAAAEELAAAGARIYAIGVGSVEGELIPVREDGKGMEFLKDREGKVVKSRLDEETLQQLAVKTQGIYVRSAAGDFGMETVYEKGIGQLQRQAHEERLQKRYFERFQWPLGIGVVLLVIEMFVSDRKRVVVLALLLLAGVSQAAENCR